MERPEIDPETPIIAVVDDDDSVRSALDNLLQSLGFGVATFASAEAFLDSPACHRVACLITDVQMPGMSGSDMQRHLAATGNRVPVILITAFPKDQARKQAEADGAFGYFAKPFDTNALIACIENALSCSSKI